MTRTLIGRDSSGVGCIKIMEGNYDPYTTPDSDFAKFRFNSKWDANLQFAGQDSLSYSSNGEFYNYYPSGTNKNTWKRLRFSYDLGDNSLGWTKQWFEDAGGRIDYDLPLFDARPIDSNGWITYCRIQKATGTFDTRWYSFGSAYGGWALGLEPTDAVGGEFANANPRDALFGYVSSQSVERGMQTIVWNLPGDETETLFPATTPVAGQKIVQITKDFCRVAKPGYSVTDIPAKLAFDSANRPAKVVASGDMALPSGVVTTFDFSANLDGISVTGGLVADVIIYKGSTITFPATIPDDEDDYGCPYRINGLTIEFNNSGSSARARFIIYAQDTSAHSAGSNKVLRQVTINGENVVQFLRPGAANPPTLADVVIDSRWPCLQIIKTGVFNIPSGGGEITDITFNSSGLFPFIKYHTVHPAAADVPRCGGLWVNWKFDKLIRLPQVAAGFVRNPNSGEKINYVSGETTTCELTTNRARFRTFRGNPYRLLWSDNAVEFQSVKAPATKIRYYIFGIPA